MSHFLDFREEDNLSIVDKRAGPKVSFIQRFNCIAMGNDHFGELSFLERLSEGLYQRFHCTVI